MNYLAYRRSLHRLNWERKREDRRLSKLVAEAEKTGGHKLAEEVYQAESFDLYRVDEEIAYLKSRYLISKANKLSLPIPPANDNNGFWKGSRYIGKWYLTSKGIMEIRQLVRQERKENLELISHWATILIGVIGAITGLIAVIMR